MKTLSRRWILLGLAALVMVPPAVFAQPADDSADTTEVKKAKGQELVLTAEFMKKKLNELLMAMSEVAGLMEKTEPEVAKILRRTIELAQREDVDEKMAVVIRSLKKGLAEAAQKEQGEVIVKLTQMLRILEGGVQEKSDTDAKIIELQEVRKRLDKNIEQQKAEEKKTRPAAHAEQIDAETKRILKELEGIVKKQKQLMSQTGKIANPNASLRKLAGLRQAIRDQLQKQQAINESTKNAPLGRLPVLSEAQKKLAAKAGELKKQVEKTSADKALAKSLSAANVDGKALKKVGELVKSAAGEMKRASGSLAKSSKAGATRPQQQAEADLKAAEKMISQAMEKLGQKTPSGKAAAKQSKLAGKTAQLAEAVKAVAAKAGIDPKTLKGSAGKKPGGDLNKAASHMNKASNKLASANPKAAGKHQKKALEELTDQLKKVADLRRKAMAAAKKKMNSAEQKEIAAAMKKLAEKMKKGMDGKKMAGQQSVSKAGCSASSAAEKMDKPDACKANKEQKKTLEEMKKARQQLDEEIAKLERRSKAEKLARLEDRLQKVLEQQKVTTARTARTYKNRGRAPAEYDRQAQQALSEMARIEGELAEEIAAIRKLLVKEGTTVVFPEVLADVKNDLADVQKRLADKDPGPLTQATQEEIERALEELVGAVRKELSKGPGRKKGGGGGGGGGGGKKKKPLIPPLAELRMLRLQQIRVNTATKRLDKMIASKKITGDQAKTEHKKLSERQAKVLGLTKKIAEKMKKGQ
ncbi:MAG: hypothetical protein K8S55_16230 [Phycisphaerae bacterium]|nr:hypothetical protein [Phycisphaerae bacterium]